MATLRGRELGPVAKKHSSERSQLPDVFSKTPQRLGCPTAPAKSPDVPEALLEKRTCLRVCRGHWAIHPLG